jgi:hypothetical protein
VRSGRLTTSTGRGVAVELEKRKSVKVGIQDAYVRWLHFMRLEDDVECYGTQTTDGGARIEFCGWLLLAVATVAAKNTLRGKRRPYI